MNLLKWIKIDGLLVIEYIFLMLQYVLYFIVFFHVFLILFLII